MAEQKYQRLTRERARFNVAISTRSSLWLGDDHLLHVECTGYTENYKRFFFRDIQAITIYKTARRALWNGILAPLFALSALIVLTLAYGNQIAMYIWGGVVVIVFGIPLLLNNLFGPTCACEIRTAVQTEDLPSICRVRQAHKVLDEIRPLIAAAQGQLTADEANARMQQLVQVAPAASVPAFAGEAPPVIT